MKAFLHAKSLWTIVSGAEKHPDDSKANLQAKWDIRADKAAGQLYLSLSAEQRTHIDAVQDDPAQIWLTLESIHLQQHPGAQFNAWDDFFSTRKKQDESLTSLIARIEDSMSKIQQLRPKDASTPYTIKDLDNELICMAMVRSLGEEYSHFASSLLLFQSLENESSSGSQSTSQAMEFTGNASLRSFNPSSSLYPLQLNANVHWNVDTEATPHMTPHRHWVRNYTPKCIPVKLADNKVVYSAGVGSVVFVLVIRGRKQRPVEFTNVLHVPDLRNNLLSVLYLCQSKGFLVSIDSMHMAFR